MKNIPSLESLTIALKEFRDERNWAQFHSPKNLAMSVSIEAAELLEVFQWRDETEKLAAEQVLEAEDEIADVFIYLLLLSDSLGVDPLKVAAKKLEQNRDRFPAERFKGRFGKPEPKIK